PRATCPPGRRLGAAQQGLLPPAVAALPLAPPDARRFPVGGQSSAGLGVGGWPPDLLADLGPQSGDGRGEILRVQCAGACVAGTVAACGLQSLERGALLSRQQGRSWLPRFPRAALRGADAPLGAVLGDLDVRRWPSGAVAGGKIRR